jgi:hypothetical protein
MKTAYLLPCQCGEKLQVDSSQAGLSVHCRCGADVSIPTLRGLDKLERSAGQVATPARVWGPRQAVIFLGGFLTALALPAVAGLRVTAPAFPQAQIDALIEQAGTTEGLDQLPPEQLYSLWKQLKQGSVYNAELVTLISQYDVAATAHRQRVRYAVGALVLGASILGVGFLIPKSVAARRVTAQL